jgi:hypothetical protein
LTCMSNFQIRYIKLCMFQITFALKLKYINIQGISPTERSEHMIHREQQKSYRHMQDP